MEQHGDGDDHNQPLINLNRINGPHRGARVGASLPHNKYKYLSDGIRPQLDLGEDKIR